MLFVGNFCILTQMDHVNHELNGYERRLKIYKGSFIILLYRPQINFNKS